MGQLIKVLDKEIMPLVINDQPVMTFKMIDEIHDRVEDHAGRSFRQNRTRFIEGEDFFKISSGEIRRSQPSAISSQARGDMIVMTESGYLMIVKSFTDNRAWDVQRALVRCYFKVKETVQAAPKGVYVPNSQMVKINQQLMEFNELLKAKIPAEKKKKKYSPPMTNEQACRIYDLEKQGLTGKKIAEDVGMSSATISHFLQYRPALPLR
jgi:hypothetical protein